MSIFNFTNRSCIISDMKNRWDRKERSGFTIIEVMIFLAISGVLIVGVIAGSSVIVSRHRYNDSVQDLTQFLRGQYSAVINTQIFPRDSDISCILDVNTVMSGGQVDYGKLGQYFDIDGNSIDAHDSTTGRGRTNCLVYGMAITFGGNDGNTIQMSPLVGRDVANDPDIDNKSDLELLKESGVNNLRVVFRNFSNNGTRINGVDCFVQTVGGSFTRNLEWGATIQETSNDDTALRATLLIFRSPRDGAIRTYVHPGPFTSNGAVVDFSTINGENGGNGRGLKTNNNGNCNGDLRNDLNNGYNTLIQQGSINNYLEDGVFVREDLIICVGSRDVFALNGQRRMIRVKADGRNSSAVELVDLDSEHDPLTNPEGNQCRV